MRVSFSGSIKTLCAFSPRTLLVAGSIGSLSEEMDLRRPIALLDEHKDGKILFPPSGPLRSPIGGALRVGNETISWGLEGAYISDLNFRSWQMVSPASMSVPMVLDVKRLNSIKTFVGICYDLNDGAQCVFLCCSKEETADVPSVVSFIPAFQFPKFRSAQLHPFYRHNQEFCAISLRTEKSVEIFQAPAKAISQVEYLGSLPLDGTSRNGGYKAFSAWHPPLASWKGQLLVGGRDSVFLFDERTESWNRMVMHPSSGNFITQLLEVGELLVVGATAVRNGTWICNLSGFFNYQTEWQRELNWVCLAEGDPDVITSIVSWPNGEECVDIKRIAVASSKGAHDPSANAGPLSVRYLRRFSNVQTIEMS